MKLLGHRIRPWLCTAVLVAAPAAWTAQAPKPHPQVWKLSGHTWVKLVPREAGAPANDHPVALDASSLAVQLGSIRIMGPSAEDPLFDNDEVINLSEPLRKAFAVAAPGEDLLLLSTNRRGTENLMKLPRAVTMRLFWRDGAMQVIVHDARFDFLASDDEPTFTFGSRTAPGAVQLRSARAANVRADWLAFQAQAALPAPAAPAAAPVPLPPVPAEATVPPPPAPVTEPAPPRPGPGVLRAAGAASARAQAPARRGPGHRGGIPEEATGDPGRDLKT